jgi:thiosulfate reductase cytochrome b subunit
MGDWFQPLGKTLIAAGLLIIIIGALLVFHDKLPFLGKLPGDFYIKRKNFTFHFPLATSILLSLLISILIYLFRK